MKEDEWYDVNILSFEQALGEKLPERILDLYIIAIFLNSRCIPWLDMCLK